MNRKSSLDLNWYHLEVDEEGAWLVKQDDGIRHKETEKKDASNFLRSLNRELLEDKLICKMRNFADEGFRDFTTGFQRYEARGVIDLVREHDKLKEEKEV